MIAMADYKAEKALVLAVPHGFFDWRAGADSGTYYAYACARQRRPRGCPF